MTVVSEAHVYPLGDLIEHVHDGVTECACGPRSIPVEREDGSVGWVEVHHSLDGRELDEASNQRRDAQVEAKINRVRGT